TSSGGAGGNPYPGTPAYEIFHEASGDFIVDFAPNLVDYGSAGWWVEMKFTDLDPAKTYTFVGTVIRSSSYSARITLVTVSDADVYTNNSSIPPAHPDWVGTDTTKLQAGDNSSTGYIVRWDDIVPGADGDFTIRSEATADSDGGRAYPINGFMLQQTGAVGNRRPLVDAGGDQTGWLRSSSITVQLDGDVSDDGQGDPNGYLAVQWTRTGGTGEGPILFKPGSNIADPCLVIYDFGSYELQLEATDGALSDSDTMTITVKQGLKGDLVIDNKVDWMDMADFCELWLDERGSEADLVNDDGVNETDYAVLAGNWWTETLDALVEISEFMADNKDTISTVYEPGGEEHSPDWIEIHNLDANAVDLGGWYLTDDASDLDKWRLPYGFIIGGGGYRIVFASGLGDSVNQFVDAYGYYHTNFQLGKDGEYLALVSPGGLKVVHEYADYEYDDDKFGYPPQKEDYSYGILGASKRYFSTPTPGEKNIAEFEGFVADTQFSHRRGFYYSDFYVQLATETSGATIRYTTDGSAPSDSHGAVYVPGNAIHITTTTCLRAGAFKSGWMPSNIDTQTYIFPEDVLGQATNPSTGAQVVPTGYPASWGSIAGDYQVDPEIVNNAVAENRLTASDMRSVPTFSLVLDPEDLFGSRQIYLSGDGVERLCSIELINGDGSTGFHENGTIQIQGGSSTGRWKSKKLSMRYKFKEFMSNGTPTGGTTKLNYQLYPDAPINQYDNIIFDGVLNNSWSHGTDAGQRANCMFIQDQYVGDLHNAMGGHSPRGLFAHIYLNGLYWGMYYVHDRPDHAWAQEMFGGDKEEQHALKHNKVTINNGNGNSAVGSYNAMLSAGAAAGANSTNLALWETLTDKLDVDNFITYVLAHWFPGTDDWCSATSAKNIYYTCRDASEGRWRFHTWDAEHTMKGGTVGFEVSPHGLHTSLKPNIEYKTRFGDLVHRFFYNNGVMSGLNPYNMYLARMTEIDRAIVGESARWGDAWDSTPRTREQWLNVQLGKLSSLNGRPHISLTGLDRRGSIRAWLRRCSVGTGAGAVQDSI
ncbi:MAG: CotH kinase family protein, partial [Sedimentisphaerales bacterium]|nr:CotH kinase family protein [Sedimentisphaerales bacterium]